MSPRTAKQFEEIRVEKRKVILDTALELFANKGYHATSISAIASAAKISKGLMYNYFENKEALLKAIFVESTNQIWNHFDPNRDRILTKDEFIYFIHKNFECVKENTNHFKLYTGLMLQSEIFEVLCKDYPQTKNDDKKLTPEISDLIIEDFSHAENDYTRMLSDFFCECGCKDPEAEILIFSSVMKGAIIQYVSAPQYFPIDLFEQKAIEFYKDRFNIK
jgi:AcrR family transcriptional regulator